VGRGIKPLKKPTRLAFHLETVYPYCTVTYGSGYETAAATALTLTKVSMLLAHRNLRLAHRPA